MCKRAAAFILAVSLIIGLFSGCVGAPSETQVPTDTVTEVPAAIDTEPPTEEPTEVPTEPPTEAPTEAPTEPGPSLAFSESAVLLTEKGQQLLLYCGDVPLEEISWFSDDETIALFSQGTVVAINAGTTQVYATYRDQKVSCQVTCDVDPQASAARIPFDLLHAPRMAPPYVEDMSDTSFFNDAAFIGDSVSYVLQQWHIRNGSFGNAVFLVRSSLGLQNTIDGRMKINYQGKSLSPEDAVEQSGVKKLFVLLGFNDVGLFGIEGTLERWDIFLGRILEKCPDLEIYIQSCTSIHHKGESKSFSNELFDEYNAALEVYCEEKGYHFVNIAPYFKDFSNSMPSIYSSDQFVHMSYEGVAAWERVLKAYAAEQKGES